MEKTIEIPEGYEAKIEGNKVILESKLSEDERMIKAIHIYLDWLKDRKDYEPKGEYSLEDMISWIEKQGEQNPKSADFIPTNCTSDAKNENRWHKVEDSLPDNAKEVLCKDAIGNFFIGRYYNDGDYWEVSMYDEPDKSNKDNPPVIMWANIPSCEQNLANSEKTCKVEPKFHKGEWVFIEEVKGYKNGPFRIKAVSPFGYDFDKYHIIPFEHEHVLSKWTIQDAKNGDVLFYEGNVNNSNGIKYERICIFNNLNNAFFTLTKYSNYIEEYAIDVNIDYPDNTVPATKEQKEILFMIMKDAGYEWDAEKKELRKIDQSPAWSEDEKPLLEKFKQAVYDCAWGKVTCKAEGETKEEYANRFAERFLLIVRDWADDYIDYTIQQKLRKSYDEGKEDAIKENSPAWSEEDERIYKVVLEILNSWLKGTIGSEIIPPNTDRYISWFKFLKERYTWKPSDEQMQALEFVVKYHAFADQNNRKNIVALINDLKKLKG